MSQPVIFLAFASDREDHLPMINQERKNLNRIIDASPKMNQDVFFFKTFKKAFINPLSEIDQSIQAVSPSVPGPYYSSSLN